MHIGSHFQAIESQVAVRISINTYSRESCTRVYVEILLFQMTRPLTGGMTYGMLLHLGHMSAFSLLLNRDF
jgi:hypothetical protein